MNKFTLCFTINSPESHVYEALITAKMIAQTPGQSEIYFSGIPFEFWHKIQPANSQILEVFHDQNDLSASEQESLQQHQSLLFLRGQIDSLHKFNYVQSVINMLLEQVATSVYFEHCGNAFTRENWREFELIESIDPWVKFMRTEGSLWTLGLAALDMPDLKLAVAQDDELEAGQDLLLGLIEMHLNQELKIESGCNFVDDEANKYSLQKANTPLFKKGDELYNPKGTLVLTKK